MQHQVVGQDNRKRLAPDEVARAPHRVAKAECLRLARVADLAGGRLHGGGERQFRLLAARLQRLHQLEVMVEVILDGGLAAAGDEDDLLDSGLTRLLHPVLDERLVDDRKHLLGDRLGGRQKARDERSEEHTSELQSLMRISYADFCLKKKN